MSKQPLSRKALLPPLAAHVLEHGLQGASLRPLARAAGTSDRMLIYHFGNKKNLITELLAHIAEVYSGSLNAGMGSRRATTRQQVVDRILAHGREPGIRPFMVLWWEIVAGAARGVPGYADAAERVMRDLLGWLEKQMPIDDPDPAGGARYLLTLIEGSLMLGVVGHKEIAIKGIAASGL